MCWAKIWGSTNSILLIISSWSWAADCWCHWETSAGASPETLDYFHNLHKPSWWVDENMWAFFWKIKSIKLSCSLCSFSNQAHIQQSYYSDYWKSTKLNFLEFLFIFLRKMLVYPLAFRLNFSPCLHSNHLVLTEMLWHMYASWLNLSVIVVCSQWVTSLLIAINIHRMSNPKVM